MYQAKRFLVTSALPYANGPLHIGHLAGAYLPADVFVRFQRMDGKDIAYIGGSDEHGAAITIKALKENTTPQEIIDKYHALFVKSFEAIGIDFDMYHRTSAELHHETSQEIFLELYNKGIFETRESEQYYDEEAKQFLADRYIIGTCPKCQHDSAYGDQCENCGSALSPLELENPRSTLSGSKPVLKKTTHWYLPLDKSEEWLREWITNGKVDGVELHDPSMWKNHVLGQCKSWLDGGLQPRAMTRDLDWGVDVPQEIPGAEGKKLYVWMDAPIGYISSTKAWAEKNNTDWKAYWQDKDTALIHFIGKDNIVFHCLIFPAILKEVDDYILPINVPANQFLNLEGDKISTSRNWAVWVDDFVEELPQYIDELRYHMIKNMPEQRDSEFTWQGFQESVNNELVNNLANFINRVVVLTHKYYDGVVPEFDENSLFNSAAGEDEAGFHDSEMIYVHDLMQEIGSSIRKFEFRQALQGMMEISAAGNKLLQFNEPWKMIKDKDEAETVKAIMNLGLQYTALLSIAMKPFMPHKSDELRKLLNLEPIERSDAIWMDTLNSIAEGNLVLQNGHKIGKPNHLFSRIDDEVIEKQLEKLKNNREVAVESSNGVEIKPQIDFNDFTKLDIRTATITEAEMVAKTKKLLKLTLDLGFEKRTVVSGIAEQYKPEEVIGRKVSLLANLAPRKIRGVESNGMILMAADQKGRLSFVSPDNDLEDGSAVS